MYAQKMMETLERKADVLNAMDAKLTNLDSRETVLIEANINTMLYNVVERVDAGGTEIYTVVSKADYPDFDGHVSQCYAWLVQTSAINIPAVIVGGVMLLPERLKVFFKVLG